MMPKPLIFALIVGLGLFTAKAQTKIERESDSRFIVAEGDYLPHVIYVADGDTINNDMFENQVTLFAFATSWCPFSKSYLYRFEKTLWKKYRNDPRFNFVCFCIDTEADMSKFGDFVAEYNLTFPVVYDPNELIYRKFATPKGIVTRSIIADKKERIVYLNDEYDNRNFRRTRRLIKKLIHK
ncbi:MAG: redoxin family protein [Bacteroidales bacterium]|nr:redoxin family protein [Bacteroidales bacterium]